MDQMLARQEEEVATRTRGVLAADSPPLWQAFGDDTDSSDVGVQFKALRHEHWQSLKDYVSEPGSLVLLWVLLWPALALLMGALQRKAAVWVQQDRSLETAVTLLGRPVSTALVVTARFSTRCWSRRRRARGPPRWAWSWRWPSCACCLRLLPESLRPAPYLAVLLFLLHQAVRLAPDGSVLYRLALLAFGAGGDGRLSLVDPSGARAPGQPGAGLEPGRPVCHPRRPRPVHGGRSRERPGPGRFLPAGPHRNEAGRLRRDRGGDGERDPAVDGCGCSS